MKCRIIKEIKGDLDPVYYVQRKKFLFWKDVHDAGYNGVIKFCNEDTAKEYIKSLKKEKIKEVIHYEN